MDNNIISLLNGILHLDSMILYRHDSRFNTSYRVMADYYRNPAECPRFEQFLYELSGGDTDIIKRIYQMIGYTISPKLDKKVLFLLQGVPNSGKTLLSSFVESLFNPEAVFSMDIERYEGKFNVSELMGKALCISPDMSGKPLSRALVSKLKQLTGNDTIGVERKFKSMVTFRNTATILLGTNYPLLTAEPEEGFEERVVTIPFRFSTPKEQRDSSLLDKLKQERSAIVSKAINLYHEMELSGTDFVGKYIMNEYVMKPNEKNSYNTDIRTLVYQFVQDDSGVVFVCDAKRLFLQEFEYVGEYSFEILFGKFVKQEFNAVHAKKRKSHGDDAEKGKAKKSNPMSCYQGIRFVNM